ncbi:MAG: hypothetical protein HW411_465 [Gammaproteobacteria bacterium]|nr:hypothetical protein [Gammaproteobacteria bacterium]
MVAAPAATDAISRAKALPTLNVGLHLVLVSGRPCLSSAEIPDLIDEQEEFSSNPVASGFKMFFLPKIRRQLEAEIRAQFEAFKKTGLRLDHVNAHKHMHLHPTVLEMIIRIGKDYDLKAVRVPDEPPLDALIDNRKEKILRYARWLFLKPWVSRMKKHLRTNNIHYNDFVYGLHDSGHMNIDTLIRILSHLPAGLSEIYSHPATQLWDDIDPEADHYEYEAEYKALIHPRIKRMIDKFSIELIGFGNLH